MLRSLLLVACLAFTSPVLADGDTGLTELETADDTRGWEAVGRIDIGYGGFCTGALVAPDMVLTAAHCLFNEESGKPIPVGDMEFLAGWRNGRAEAYRKVRRAVAHPDYDYGSARKVSRVARDLALLELDRPIRSNRIKPFETVATRLRKGAEVTVVSYAEDRAGKPSLQQSCHVLESFAGVGMLSCAVDSGASGAPIFLMEENGPRIVSVVSAKAEAYGKPVALAGELRRSMETLQAELADVPTVRLNKGSLLSGAPDADRLGAKFLRP